MNFAMSDIYGGIWGTTETTIPEAADQKAIVDDQKAAEAVYTGKKKVPVYSAIIILVVIAVLFGVLK